MSAPREHRRGNAGYISVFEFNSGGQSLRKTCHSHFGEVFSDDACNHVRRHVAFGRIARCQNQFAHSILMNALQQQRQPEPFGIRPFQRIDASHQHEIAPLVGKTRFECLLISDTFHNAQMRVVARVV